MPHHTQPWTLSDTEFIQDLNVTCHPGVYYYGKVLPFLLDIFLNSCLLNPQSDPLATLRKPVHPGSTLLGTGYVQQP